MIQIYSLEHAPHEDPVYITQWLYDRQIILHPVRLYLGDHFPDLNDVGILLIMGGFINIYDEDDFPWLVQEKLFIKAVIDAGKPVLGICLGGQLVSDILGGRVTKASVPEYGWHTTSRVCSAVDRKWISSSQGSGIFPDKIEVFEWHQDTFSIPPGAVRIYASDLCENQAYVYRDRIIGLQFHPEMDDPTIRDFLVHSSPELREKGIGYLESDIISRIGMCASGHQFIAGIMQYLLEVGS
jgi:GMP synthase-like glutamine amidotransferase